MFSNWIMQIHVSIFSSRLYSQSSYVKAMKLTILYTHPFNLGVKESFESQSGLPRKAIPQWKDEEHPGCQISGFLMVDRVPGNFHIKARS